MILLFLANGFEEVEALTPLDLLRRAGDQVRTVGIGGKRVIGAHRIMVEADLDEAEIPEESPEMVILPGGMPGAANLNASTTVERVLARTEKSGGILAAICAAPMVLGRLGYLRGRRAVCYPGFEDQLTGARVEPGAGVVRDANVVTAEGMGVAFSFGLELVAALHGQETADRIRASVMAPKVN